jgi:TRAP-type C4-dicarboxylate transport system permease small subunit
MRKIVEWYFHLLKATMVFCLVMMVILVFGNVVLRYGFNSGITVSEELSRMFFVYLTFIGAIVAMREHLHLGVDSLVRKLPVAGKKACFVASQCLMLYACWLFGQGSWQQTLINLHVVAPVSGMSMGVFYGVGMLFSASAGIIIVHDIWRVLSGRIAEEELVMVKESEEQTEIETLTREAQAGALAGIGRPDAGAAPHTGSRA